MLNTCCVRFNKFRCRLTWFYQKPAIVLKMGQCGFMIDINSFQNIMIVVHVLGVPTRKTQHDRMFKIIKKFI